MSDVDVVALRPFLPAKDFALSKRFYQTFGFELLRDDGDVAIFGLGPFSFILQDSYDPDWAENCVMQLLVDDLDAWWEHIESLNLGGGFGVDPPSPPAVRAGGQTVAYVFDPSGILWHVSQNQRRR